jgi:cell division transport system permease protein
MLIGETSQDWRQSISREMTIQVRPIVGRDLEAETAKAVEAARAFPGIADVRAYTKAESEALLQPWLGAGLDLSELPVPRLIVLKLASHATLDAAALNQTLADKVVGATLDDHRLWLSRLAVMAQTVVVVGLVIFLLVLVAMMLAVGFATRGAMAGNREIIEVLHFVGAADQFISRQFQNHFFRLGLRGGGIGGGAAILVFLVLGRLSSWWRATPGGDQIEAMFGSFGLEFKGYLLIVLIAAGIAVTTGFVSRVIVFRHLRRLS